MMVDALNLSTQEAEAGGGLWGSVSLRPVWFTREFQASQGYLVRPCLKQTKKPYNNKRKEIVEEDIKYRLAFSATSALMSTDISKLLLCSQCLSLGNMVVITILFFNVKMFYLAN